MITHRFKDVTSFEIGYAPIRIKDKVCIVGCAHSNWTAPLEDDSYEFWGVNNLFLGELGSKYKNKFTRWFEIHNIEQDKNTNIWLRRGDDKWRGSKIKDYLDGLQGLNIPIYMQKPVIPNAIPYPLGEIKNKYGNYLTNTISLEIALALYEDFQEIKICGVEMARGTEYYGQKPSCEYFIGLALGMGKKVDIPNESDILKSKFVYGFEEKQQHLFLKRLRYMEKIINDKKVQAEEKHRKLKKKIDQATGYQSAINDFKNLWTNLSDEED